VEVGHAPMTSEEINAIPLEDQDEDDHEAALEEERSDSLDAA